MVKPVKHTCKHHLDQEMEHVSVLEAFLVTSKYYFFLLPKITIIPTFDTMVQHCMFLNFIYTKSFNIHSFLSDISCSIVHL